MTRLLHRCPHCGGEISARSALVGAVLKAIGSGSEAEIDRIRGLVAAAGLFPTDKQLYNALGYLTRRRKVKRISYGRYAGVSP